jgi:hypothetical protein
MNKKSLIILVLLSIYCEIYSQNWFSECNNNGGYFKFENSFTTNLLLKQEVRDFDFNESDYSELISYPTIKLGYSRTGFDFEASDYPLFYDLGVGLVYSKSRMNAVDSLDLTNTPPVFSSGVPNYETFFDYYQTGNRASVNDFGLNIHADFGGILYAGVEVDAGLSKLTFNDSKVSGQKVKSIGWFAIPRAQLGLSFATNYNEDWSDWGWGANLKIYASFGWSFRTNTMDWISEDKKLKNFSKISSYGNPVGLGVSLSVYFQE